ncbi:unnamed protein product [Protopolystoma xenopodis]|uniref:Uncharacterized protein n=1 Tax=Protopolystoma xenopodis TaxID=117903 RepID=A0A448WS11_9PLAT|nr:unnamed protein product [Protopolystoma xenopodis]
MPDVCMHGNQSLYALLGESVVHEGDLDWRRESGLVLRMAALTDDADYDAGETSENVSIPRSDAANYDTYYGRTLPQGAPN